MGGCRRPRDGSGVPAEKTEVMARWRGRLRCWLTDPGLPEEESSSQGEGEMCGGFHGCGALPGSELGRGDVGQWWMPRERGGPRCGRLAWRWPRRSSDDEAKAAG